ncbi:hypothetical protein ABTM61_19330, partial [Acinetobacter baumannii]
EQAALKRFVEQAYCHSEIATILCNEAGLSEIERIALRETGRDQAYRNAQRRGQGEKDQSGGIQQYATHRIVPCGGGGYTSLGDRASGNRS